MPIAHGEHDLEIDMHIISTAIHSRIIAAVPEQHLHLSPSFRHLIPIIKKQLPSQSITFPQVILPIRITKHRLAGRRTFNSFTSINHRFSNDNAVRAPKFLVGRMEPELSWTPATWRPTICHAATYIATTCSTAILSRPS
jgi:hypothetical protein